MVTNMSKPRTFRLYVNGDWVDSDSGETFHSDNPTEPNQVLGFFQKGNKEDVEKAVIAASEAFPVWSQTPPPKRGLILLKAAHLLPDNKEKLAREVSACATIQEGCRGLKSALTEPRTIGI
jgi:acyl-CoA reductase-like NAD-dependent aldehyde dehydrogenase